MPQISESRYLVQAGWDDVPHLTKEAKEELLRGTEPHLRDARTQGIPALGSGAIYQVPVEEVVVTNFQIPAYWPRCYALDVGWNVTACLWLAWDRDTDTVYAYAEHYREKAEPAIHAAAIKARGDWIRGVIDPASRGRTQTDGTQLIEMYKALGLKVVPAENSVEHGINEVWQRLSSGRLKFFRSLSNLQAEYRLYRRNEKGKVVKEFDHLLDCLRYGIVSGLEVANVQVPKSVPVIRPHMGDSLIGY